MRLVYELTTQVRRVHLSRLGPTSRLLNTFIMTIPPSTRTSPMFFLPWGSNQEPPPLLSLVPTSLSSHRPTVHIHVNTFMVWSWCPGDGPHQSR